MSAVAPALIGAVRSFGGTVVLDDATIRLWAPAPLPLPLRESLRRYKPEVVAYLQATAANGTAPRRLENRLGGLPDDILAGLRGLVASERLPGVPPTRWPQVVQDCVTLVRTGKAAEALGKGWTAADLFGCDQRAPWHRIDRSGLVLLLGGRPVSGIEPDAIAIRCPAGHALRFYRRAKVPEPPVAMLWELLPKHRRPHTGPAP